MPAQPAHVSPADPESLDDLPPETTADGDSAGDSDLGARETDADLTDGDVEGEDGPVARHLSEKEIISAYAAGEGAAPPRGGGVGGGLGGGEARPPAESTFFRDAAGHDPVADEDGGDGAAASRVGLTATDVVMHDVVASDSPISPQSRQWGDTGGKVDPAAQLDGPGAPDAAPNASGAGDGGGGHSGAGSGSDGSTEPVAARPGARALPGADPAGGRAAPPAAAPAGGAGADGSAPASDTVAGTRPAGRAGGGRTPPAPPAQRPAQPAERRTAAPSSAAPLDAGSAALDAGKVVPAAERPAPPPEPPARSRRVFADSPGADRVSRSSIRRLARSTLAEMGNVPLAFVPDDDEAAGAEPAGESDIASLQHILGLTAFTEAADPALEAELTAELGVHGIQAEEFQECLARMLDTRQREQAMYAVQVRFRSVLDSIDQLSRLTTGQVRYRNERLTADSQQVVRVLLALRVASERLEESLRTCEQTVRQAHADAAAIGRFVADAQVRLGAMHKLACSIEALWQQLQAQQAAAAPERQALVWTGLAAAVGAGFVVLVLGFLGY